MMMRGSQSSKARGGFTIVELLIGVTLSVMMLGAVFSSYIFLTKHFVRSIGVTNANEPTLEVQARRTLNYFAQDVAAASDIDFDETVSPDTLANKVTLTIPVAAGTTTVTYDYDSSTQTLAPYFAALDRGEVPVIRGRELTAEDHQRREIIMRVMCHLQLDYAALSREFSCDFANRYAEALSRLQPLANDGLVELSPTSLKVTDLGRLFLRNIAVCFDAYYSVESKRHSRTV
jgi:Tfp pilus assembly protein PilE|uniref:hypothetical protein n=1 Tax=Cephaloticoccus sp. TaxID=1985742 RepID=UPI00404AF115